MKLLIVDDDPLFLEFLCGIVQKLGHSNIETAESGEAALEKIAASPETFDCILLDIQMPGMDGIELCRRVRSVPRYASVPIVMITALAEKSYVDSAFEAGANDYVNKPIDMIEVKARLGMVQRIHYERAQSGVLMQQLSDTEKELGRNIEFASSDIFSDPELGLLPYTSFENYLLRLGNLRLLSSSVCALAVTNADILFASLPRVDFVDAMSEVGKQVNDTLSHTSRFVSYAGRGTFCVLLPRLAVFEKDAIEAQLNDELHAAFARMGFDAAFGPRVAFGPTHGFNPFAFKNPTETLETAIAELHAEKVTFAA